MIKEYNLIKINNTFLLKYRYNDPENCLIEPIQKVEGMEEKIDMLENACLKIMDKVDEMSN